jgi:hypothetical protein
MSVWESGYALLGLTLRQPGVAAWCKTGWLVGWWCSQDMWGSGMRECMGYTSLSGQLQVPFGGSPGVGCKL